jgi:hypothetical protein
MTILKYFLIGSVKELSKPSLESAEKVVASDLKRVQIEILSYRHSILEQG